MELCPREGSALTDIVTVRNPTSEVVSVTGVAADEGRDGAAVADGTVRGCPFGGPPAGPEREPRTDGGAATQAFDLEIRAQGC